MVLVESESAIATWKVAPTAEDPHTLQFYAQARATAELFVTNQRNHGVTGAEILRNALAMIMPFDGANEPNYPVLEMVACVEDTLVKDGVPLLAHDIRKNPLTPRVQFPDAYQSYLDKRKRDFARTAFSPNGSKRHTETF